MIELEEIQIENNQQLLGLPLIQVLGIVAGTMIHEDVEDATLFIRGITADDMKFDFKVCCNLIKENDSFFEKIKSKLNWRNIL